MTPPTTTVILPRTDPDLDGVACAIGYSEYLSAKGTASAFWLPGTPDDEASYVLARYGVTSNTSSSICKSPETRFVLVDASGTEGLPEEVHPTRIIEVIDHRRYGDPNVLFPNARIQIECVGAAATLIVERFQADSILPSSVVLAMLYGAIHSNTQCLCGAVTHQRDRDASAWLAEIGNIPEDLLEQQFSARESGITANLSSAVAREQKTYCHSTGPYAIAQLELRGATELVHREHAQLTGLLRTAPTRLALNMVDVLTATSVLIVEDTGLRRLIEDALEVQFSDSICQIEPCILRKQIVASLEERNVTAR
jgi:inorganic pyrophosphatase/exopolyphosphatase